LYPAQQPDLRILGLAPRQDPIAFGSKCLAGPNDFGSVISPKPKAPCGPTRQPNPIVFGSSFTTKLKDIRSGSTARPKANGSD